MGDSCKYSVECASGTCSSGTCTGLAAGASCLATGMCAMGHGCVAGTCQPFKAVGQACGASVGSCNSLEAECVDGVCVAALSLVDGAHTNGTGAVCQSGLAYSGSCVAAAPSAGTYTAPAATATTSTSHGTAAATSSSSSSHGSTTSTAHGTSGSSGTAFPFGKQCAAASECAAAGAQCGCASNMNAVNHRVCTLDPLFMPRPSAAQLAVLKCMKAAVATVHPASSLGNPNSAATAACGAKQVALQCERGRTLTSSGNTQYQDSFIASNVQAVTTEICTECGHACDLPAQHTNTGSGAILTQTLLVLGAMVCLLPYLVGVIGLKIRDDRQAKKAGGSDIVPAGSDEPESKA